MGTCVCLCAMYDFRCTIWKFGEPPARGILRSGGERDVVKPCAEIVTKRRESGGRRGLPMYDGRWTMYDLEIWRVAGSRNFAERGRTGCRETVRGDRYKAAGRRGQTRSAYVRWTMDDCQICALCAGKRPAAVRAYGQRVCAARRVKTDDGCKSVWPKAQLLPRRGENWRRL